MDGGGDYELLFTVLLADHDKIKKEFDFTIIGHITEEGNGANLITGSGSAIPLQAQGWNPLKN